jgi:hypothetical protein
MNDCLQNLPGEEFIRAGLADYLQQRVTISSCLVAIARPALRRAAMLPSEELPAFNHDVELTLYRLLRADGGDAYARYNALLRRLVSFEQALARRIRTSGLGQNIEAEIA